ncbi:MULTISPECIES: hypothetical protein [Clostridiaceae]|uniref:Twitching motility protein PilT n=1 Tax=Clostridium facile TaxID=2763035 RepID=A0ABR7IQZ7_9CLOT|nr:MULTISPECIES: hypothetical protein [Clostridiaceae]MBC5787553.1 hypothetical protein [Clostridium facile]PWN00473.1 MAG: hypothetical protein DBX37_01745 [Massilioclostridium sp.]
MIKLILGKKGSGKTKILLEAVRECVSKTDGDIVFIDNSDQHTFELDHKVRLVNALHYDVTNIQAFKGFIAGILAGNYDITDIYVDAILRIVGRDYDLLGQMLDEIDKICTDVNITFTVSADRAELPESVTKFA